MTQRQGGREVMEAFETWYWSRMERISRIEMVAKKEVLKIVNEKKVLLNLYKIGEVDKTARCPPSNTKG